MDFKISIDSRAIEKQIDDDMKKRFALAAEKATRDIFSANRYIKEGKVIREVGAGLQEIEDRVIGKFSDPSFIKEIDAFFEENWKAIFEKAITKAIEHKANAIAFAKAKEIKLFISKTTF